MQVIPGINCPDLPCVKKKLLAVRRQLSNVSWVHIDVADGRFTKTLTWNNPEDLDSLGDELGDLKLEIHLMVNDPAAVVEDWLRHGANRIIVQFEALGDGWEIVCDKVEREGRELTLSIGPQTPVHALTPYLKAVSLVQLLAVEPGPAGQKFNPVVLEKLKELKQKEPDLMVEIDGGINLETAKIVKRAGADIIVSASYLWQSRNPKKTYEELSSV